MPFAQFYITFGICNFYYHH